MKRLLCIVSGMNAGGAETFLMKIYRNLNKSLYQMDFAVGIKEEGFYDKEILSMGGKIYHIPPKSKGLFQNFKEIKKLVRDNEYNYVLRISQHSLSALELLAAKQGGAKVRVFRSSNTNTASNILSTLLHHVFIFMPKHFANVKMAPSTEAGDFVFGKGATKKGDVIMLHNGIDLDTYCFDKDARDEIRNIYSLTDKQIIGHVGRFNQQKNHEFLINVFEEYSKVNPDAVLMLVGKGELEDSIKNKVYNLGIKDKVIFMGIRSDIPQVMSAMDVLAFPSQYEGMPNTIIEAQAVGLPCLVSDKVTKEANITGKINYLPIDNKAIWVESLQKCNSERYESKKCFIENGYDINTVVSVFVKSIFETVGN